MVTRGRAQYYAAFESMGLAYVPCHTNFILVRVGDGAGVYAEALARGVITRPMGGYGLPEYIRITIGNEAENTRCIAVLRELLG